MAYALGMRAMLVAAGLGTRLHPLTHALPKPALPVGNRPTAFFACDHLARSGFRDLVVNTHHLAERLRDELEQACPAGVRLRFVHEPVILGTGGALRNAWQPVDGEDFVAVNAKLLFAPDLERAMAVHAQSGAIATMVLRTLPPGTTFAGVDIESDGRVRKIRGEPQSASGSFATRMFTGVQILSPRAWRDLPEHGDLIEHAYLPWLARGEIVASITDDSPWMDVGVTPRHYLDANLALVTGGLRWPGISPDPAGVLLGANVILGKGAQLDQVTLGDGCTIAPAISLRRVVAWRGAHVHADLQDAVVMTDGTIVRV